MGAAITLRHGTCLAAPVALLAAVVGAVVVVRITDRVVLERVMRVPVGLPRNGVDDLIFERLAAATTNGVGHQENDQNRGDDADNSEDASSKGLVLEERLLANCCIVLRATG